MTDADVLQADGELPEEVHRIKRNRDIQTGQWHKQGEQTATLDIIFHVKFTFLTLDYTAQQDPPQLCMQLFLSTAGCFEVFSVTPGAHSATSAIVGARLAAPARQNKELHSQLNSCAQPAGQELVRLDQYITPLKTNKLGPTEAQCFERLACLFRTDSSFLVTKRVSTPHVSCPE